jgi:hypothetical protein
VGYYLGSLRGIELSATEGQDFADDVDFVLRVGDGLAPVVVAPDAASVSEAARRALQYLDLRRSIARFALLVVAPEMPWIGADEPRLPREGTAAADAHPMPIEPELSAGVEPAREAEQAGDPRIVVVPLSSLLLLR